MEQRYKADNYLPYWPIIWPSGLMVAERILTERQALAPRYSRRPMPQTPQPQARSSLSYRPGHHRHRSRACKRLACHIHRLRSRSRRIRRPQCLAKRHPSSSGCRAMHMDWRQPVAETFPGSSHPTCCNERRPHELVLGRNRQVAGASPEVSLGLRPATHRRRRFSPLEAAERGFRVKTVYMEGESFSGGRQAGQLYILKWPEAKDKGGEGRETMNDERKRATL